MGFPRDSRSGQWGAVRIWPSMPVRWRQPLPLLQVVCYVNMNLMDASVQPLALRLLESVTLSSPVLGQLVKNEVTLDRLLVHLQV